MEQKKTKRGMPPQYDEAFKTGAVRLVTEQGRQPTEVANELGICIDTLRSWLKASGIQLGQASRQGASVGQICREWKVSRSGYYDWIKRRPSERSRRNQALRRRLVALHEKYPAMGLDSLYHLLRPEFGCSRKRVYRQMRIAGISSVRRQTYKTTTSSSHSHPIAPNPLMRNFSFQRPDQAWVGDITYIPTGEGWLSPARFEAKLCLSAA